MEVILMERIEKLGQMGDVVKVKPGYARNFLFPTRKALRATKQNLASFEERRNHLEAENLTRRTEAESVSKKIEGLSVTLIRQAGENGQLYGSVNARDLAGSISEAGVSIARGQVELGKAIKVLGLHPVKVRLHPEVAVTVTANVARSEEEAKAQEEAGHVVSADEQRATEAATVEAVIAEVEAEEEAAVAEEEEASSDSEAEETADKDSKSKDKSKG